MKRKPSGFPKRPLTWGQPYVQLDKEQYETKYVTLPDVCLDPNHEPARFLVRSSGTYQHVCPTCGEMDIFSIVNPTLNDSHTWSE